MRKKHFENVDVKNIKANFTEDRKHRSYLEIPFLNRSKEKSLCIIGQNPSDANEKFADPTAYYLEKFIYENLPLYSKIIIINLFSRIDKSKENSYDLIRKECEDSFHKVIDEHNEFLIVYGSLSNEGSFTFLDKAKSLKSILAGKSVYKINIGSDYAPHPGNPKILYTNYSYEIVRYNFEDIS